ncbi:MAG: cellulase family glycosylhydrolase [Chitinispirillaceae bacterium]|nr:cellulase family glycosylhydrolase [Chitinispirillaceae bacterium]
MKRKRNKVVLIGVILTLTISTAAQAANVWAVDANGDITLNGSVFRVKGGSWFGLEGRHELSTDENNPGGAPLELYIGNVFYSSSSRTLASDAAEMKSMGFNCIRMPVAPQTLDDSDPQGNDPNLKNTEDVRIQGAFSALKEVVKACADAGLYVLLDMHSCSNYVGWRAGRLDARPPYVDANRDQYDFKREDCSCAASGNPSSVSRIQAYDVSKWLADLKTLAGMGAELGVDNIMGIDIFNEPWDYSWSEWSSLIDQAYSAISSVNPNILIFAQGISGSNGNQDGSPDTKNETPHGDMATNPNWGENLYEAGNSPPTMPKSKLVYSPHCYGPAVCTQPMFADVQSQPECAGLIEDAFGDAKCQIVINPAKLEPGWYEHFGYLKAQGYAICIGEFGGNMDWPNKAESRHQNRYSYLTNKNSDEQWQNAFVNYLIKAGIFDSFYWSINPESSDTYGIFTSPFDPISNKSGWGAWSGTDSRKLNLLAKLWNATGNGEPYEPEPYDPGAPVIPAEHGTGRRIFTCHVSSTGLITYSLPKAAFVSLRVYNVKGRLQSKIIGRQQEAGSYSINRRQMATASGSYVVVFKVGEYFHKQMVCLTN